MFNFIDFDQPKPKQPQKMHDCQNNFLFPKNKNTKLFKYNFDYFLKNEDKNLEQEPKQNLNESPVDPLNRMNSRFTTSDRIPVQTYQN